MAEQDFDEDVIAFPDENEELTTMVTNDDALSTTSSAKPATAAEDAPVLSDNTDDSEEEESPPTPVRPAEPAALSDNTDDSEAEDAPAMPVRSAEPAILSDNTDDSDDDDKPAPRKPRRVSTMAVSQGDRATPTALPELAVHYYEDAEAFGEDVRSFLQEKPYRHSTILTILHALTDYDELPSQAFLCCVTSRDRVVAVVVQYEVWHGVRVALDENLSLDEGVDAFHVACDEMKKRHLYINRAEGLLRDAQIFSGAALETRLAKGSYPLDQQQHYRLGEDGISPPTVLIPGELRTATNEDVIKLLPDYYAENVSFFEGEERTMEQCKASLEHFADERMLLTYRYKGHDMAVLTFREVTGKIAQVTGQFTMSCYRNRGFGPALLYEAVEHLLNERGYEDVIVAASSGDEATNSVYWKLGFEPSEIMATYGIDCS
eukprot:m.48433 g.48433  ORF g.48433 m.48433 type:complete len:433 (+) comp13286_c0_seq2:925-2223(+)